MTIQKLPGTAITPGTITVVQLESTVATTVSTGGGPKITNLAITSNVNVTLDDTAVDLTGGFIRLTGTGFNTGCLVYAGLLPAASTTFISNTEVRAQLSAQTAGTYPVYLVNTDGGTAIRVPGVTYSASPAWQTASSLGDQYDGVLLNLSVVATDAVSYSVVSGSLPPGLSLNSNTGVISGTISGVVNDTVYTFTINAVDAQLQDSPRVFTINVTVSDPYFRLTTLLLTGNSGNTVVTDSSTNNFAITVVGDSRASNFSPYLTGWSNYFDGSSAYLSVADNAAFDFGAGNFTIEYWEYRSSAKNDIIPIGRRLNTSGSATAIWNLGYESSGLLSGTFNDGAGTTYLSLQMGSAFYATWNHYAVVRNGNTVTCYRNGNSVGSGTLTQTLPAGNQPLTIGRMQNNGYYFQGYISNVRLIKGTALYTANFTPATTTLTSVAGTSLLTCHANRFVDSSTNNFTITRNGDVSVVSFNPFNLTNTGTTGSVYFDGTGDYVLTISTTAMNLGANPFCLEMWFYLNSTGSTYYGLCGSQTDYKGPSISRYGSVLMYGLSSNGSSWNVMGAEGTTGSTTINPYQWYHLVLCRTGNTISAYVNGLRDATVASSATLISRTEGFCIGNWYAGLYPWNGYISSVRFVVGSNPYDATQTTLTIPAAPLTAIANTQLLTLQNRQPHNNHSFQDASSNNFLITRSGNATQGTFSPFSQSGWSVYFDGSTDCIKVPSDAAYGLGTGNFTIELFVYFEDYYSLQSRLAGQYVSGNTNGWQIFKNSNSYNLIFNTNSGDHFSYNWTTVKTGVWYHIAVVRSGTGANQTIMYVDGVNVASGTCAHSIGANQVVVGGLDWAANYSTKGYIASFRYSNVARTITVPTSPYTTDATTLVLLCQSNRFVELSANKTVTVAETPRIQAFSPFAPTAVYSPTIHGGSAYFDGTGDYLSAPSNTAFQYNTGDFTYECWVYHTSISGQQTYFARTNGNNAGVYFYKDTSNYPGVYYSSQIATSSVALVTNQWYHLVATRLSGTLRIFINGTQTASVSDTANLTEQIVYVGADSNSTSPFVGYMSNARILKGVGYSTITIPTAPVTAITNTSLLLNFTNGAIADATGRNVIETVADARTTSVIAKWTGSHSMSFDGTGDRLVTDIRNNRNCNLGANGQAFTVECWVYYNAMSVGSVGGKGGGAAAWNSTNGHQINLGSHSGGSFYVQWWNGSSIVSNQLSNPFVTGQWYHYAVTLNSGTLKAFVNGTQILSVGSVTIASPSQAYYFSVGDLVSGDTPLNGYISDFRITESFARYTANFTPPTGPARLK